MARGNLILFNRELVAGMAFMVQANTRWSGANLPKLLGKMMGGGSIGSGGRMCLCSIKFTGWR